ncbi:putative hemoglobin and hemoglobin-haptoglobin-binding protein 3 precursor, partial [Haemophilus influenzae]
MQAQL